MEDTLGMKGESQKPAVRMSEETKARLSKHGFAGESLETALIRVLDKAEKYDKEHSE
jgi:hypothetical protein